MNDSEISERPDILIVGAGPVGCVLAERFARDNDLKVLIVEKRNHIAGNCHDRRHTTGLLVHQYGPHYFRTNSDELLEYLSNFTEWIPGKYVVKSSVGGKLYPFPINLTTLEMFFGVTGLTEASALELLEKKRIPCADPQNSEDFVVSKVGREMFEAFYLNYTVKQWGRASKELDASVCGRVPIRLNRNEQYVDHKHQVMPAAGFTEMFRKMTKHRNIEIALETDFESMRSKIRPRIATIYTGPVDEYFGKKLGALPWRSLRFDFKTVETEYAQECVQINYPNEHDYTRSVEIKHVTGEKSPQTVVTNEYPEATGEPYYPVPSSESQKLYAEYKKLADFETATRRVYFAGRLATYKYFNTDEVIESALKLHQEIVRKYLAEESTSQKSSRHGSSSDG